MSRGVPQGERIATLDVVRGVAVMGILLLNIIAFAMPSAAYGNPHAYGSHSGLDYAVYNFMYIFFDGKMRGLFSFLFGASTLLVIERAEAKGESGAAVHYARMIWLLIFGLAHLYLIWWGDILQHYALIGMIAFFFRRFSVKTLVRIALPLLLAQLLLVTGAPFNIMRVERQLNSPHPSAQVRRDAADMENAFGTPSRTVIEETLKTYRADYSTIVRARFNEEKLAPVQELIFYGLETLAYMLLGMAMLKSGMLRGTWPVSRYRRWIAIGLLIGVPAYAAGAVYMAHENYSALSVAIGTLVWSTPFRPLMIMAWASAIALLAQQATPLTRRLAAAGQMAFTNYLGTSLICSTFFYGYGLGQFGSWSRSGCYLVVFGVWALMLLWSKPWLARFHYGPLEWLWRSLSRGRLQPLARGGAAAAA